MKTLKTLFCAIVLFVFNQNVQAQNKFQLTDLYLMGGASVTSSTPLTSWEIDNLEKNLFYPSSQRPPHVRYGQFQSGARQVQQMNLRPRYNAHLGVMAAWTIKRSRLGQQKIRLGLSAGSYTVNWDGNYRSSEEYRIDTLVSQQTGTNHYIDSSRTKNLYYEHAAQMFNVHADYLVYINPRNKLTFYTGLGARFGISLNNTVSANYFEYSSIGEYDYLQDETFSRYSYEILDNDFTRTTKSLSPTTNLEAHVILGGNYRLSKRSRFLKRIHLFHEFNFGLQLNNMQEIQPSIGFNAGFQSGLRVSLNKRAKSSLNKRERTRRNRI